MMIEIITTIESMKQAEELLEAGVDTLYFGEERNSVYAYQLLLQEKNNAN